jgi:hypothetical protein
MGFLDRLFGTDQPAPAADVPQRPSTEPPKSEDELAIERYRYLLRTAPPETIEQVLAELSAGLPASEQPRSAQPQDLARAATRAEYMNPGFMERSLGGRQDGRSGPGFGAMVGSSILGTVVGYVIGSAIVSSFMAPAFADQAGQDSTGDSSGSDAASEGGQDGSGADAGGDASWGDGGAADMGGFGDFGGDFGF